MLEAQYRNAKTTPMAMIRSEELAPAMAALIAEVSLAGATGGFGWGSMVSMLLIGHTFMRGLRVSPRAM